MNLAEAHEFSLLETWDQAHDAGLLAESEMVLKSDQVVTIGAQIFLAKLDGGVGPAPSAWIFKAYRLHWTEAQRLTATAGELFYRQAGFKVWRLVFGDVSRNAFACKQRIEETLVLLASERTVDVVVGAVERF